VWLPIKPYNQHGVAGTMLVKPWHHQHLQDPANQTWCAGSWAAATPQQ
jgi:hypothetical protein